MIIMIRIVSWFIYGAIFLLLVLLSFPFPQLLVSKKLNLELSSDKKKQYLLYVRIILTLLSIAIITAGLLPNHLVVPIILPFLILLFIITLVCNKKILGRWAAFKF